MNPNNAITEEYQSQGLSLHEIGDHILELRKGDDILARFTQTGIEVDNLLKVINALEERGKK